MKKPFAYYIEKQVRNPIMHWLTGVRVPVYRFVICQTNHQFGDDVIVEHSPWHWSLKQVEEAAKYRIYQLGLKQ